MGQGGAQVNGRTCPPSPPPLARAPLKFQNWTATPRVVLTSVSFAGTARRHKQRPLCCECTPRPPCNPLPPRRPNVRCLAEGNRIFSVTWGWGWYRKGVPVAVLPSAFTPSWPLEMEIGGLSMVLDGTKKIGEPKKGGCTASAPALDLTTSLRGDFIFMDHHKKESPSSRFQNVRKQVSPFRSCTLCVQGSAQKQDVAEPPCRPPSLTLSVHGAREGPAPGRADVWGGGDHNAVQGGVLAQGAHSADYCSVYPREPP